MLNSTTTVPASESFTYNVVFTAQEALPAEMKNNTNNITLLVLNQTKTEGHFMPFIHEE